MRAALCASMLLGLFQVACGSDGGSDSPPAAPTEAAARPVAGPAVHVTWKDNSSDESQFIVERRTGSGSFEMLGTVTFDLAQFHDDKVTPGTTYTYRIAATNTKGKSGYSNEATATVP
jgi:titin